MRDLYSLTGQELAALPRDRTVVFFALGGLSDHGPHLPVGLDWIEAQAIANDLGSRLEALPGGWVALRAPALSLSVARPKRGAFSLSTRGPVVRDALVDACRGLHRQGFRHFFAVSGDQEPQQLCAIEDAGRRVGYGNWRRGATTRIVFGSIASALTRPSDAWKAVLGQRKTDPGNDRDVAVARALAPQFVAPTAPATPKISGEGALRDLANEAWPKLRACLEQGANPRLLFQSWYSVVPWYRSTFTGWVLAFAVLVLWAATRFLE